MRRLGDLLDRLTGHRLGPRRQRDVGERDDAHEAALVVHHRQAPELHELHERGGLPDVVFRAAEDHARRHHFLHFGEARVAALRDGTIDLVSTDHAPHTREEKEPGWTDGWKAHTGTPSTQFYVPLLLDAAAEGRLTYDRVVEVVASAPARTFGLNRKGRLGVGCDADIAIADLDAEWEITDDVVLSKIGWTPYAGRRVHGAIETTLVRGRVVYDNGQVVGEPGWGRQARPSA